MKLWISRSMPFIFLVYGLVCLWTLKRDFEHITRLSIFLVLIVPVFLLFNLLGRALEKAAEDSHWYRYQKFVHIFRLAATQNISQYILMFVLPFLLAAQSYLYFGIVLVVLASTLWDPWYERLVHGSWYRHLLLATNLTAAGSFLYPFLLPSLLEWFYPALAAFAALAFIPTARERKTWLTLFSLYLLWLIPLVGLAPENRFPSLSVFTQKAHFEARNENGMTETLPTSIDHTALQIRLAAGEKICCVAPVVAPPGVITQIRQEWTLGGRSIESALLKTPIQGNVSQKGFRSYFCKRNFPLAEIEENLRCRIQIGDSLDLGGTRLQIRP